MVGVGWERRIVAWGNSLGVRIPNKVFQKTQLKEGDRVEVSIKDAHTITLTRVEDQEGEIDETV